jgi:hypothetical protein
VINAIKFSIGEIEASDQYFDHTGVMHRNVTHNKCYATCAQFADATLWFLRETVPRNWADLCDSVTDNFRIINPKDFRVVT